MVLDIYLATKLLFKFKLGCKRNYTDCRGVLQGSLFSIGPLKSDLVGKFREIFDRCTKQCVFATFIGFGKKYYEQVTIYFKGR